MVATGLLCPVCMRQRSQVCVVGTDVPELSHPIMERALSLLDQYEVTLQTLLLHACPTVESSCNPVLLHPWDMHGRAQYDERW